MNKYESDVCKAAEVVGTWMIITGFLVLGPVGLVLLSVLAFAMPVSEMVLALVCLLLVASPLALMMVWVPLLVAGRRLKPREVLHERTIWPDVNSEDAQPLW
jgi:hypothetical protein